MYSKDGVKEFVIKCYRDILNREPDRAGLDFYIKKIMRGEIKQEQIPSIFKESKEFKRIQQKKIEFDINFFEKNIYSQNGEDGILEFIFSSIGTTNKFFVEMGVGDGSECNTRYLLEKGWNGIMIDVEAPNQSFIKKELVTAENVNDLLRKYNVPYSFDLLSIDIDYNTYWIWKAIENFVPRVVVIEYNSTINIDKSLAVKYDPLRKWDGTNYFGASLLATSNLGKFKGYTLIGCDNMGINAFFIKNELIKTEVKQKSIIDLYRPPKFGKIVNGVHIGHSLGKESMIPV